MRYPEGKTPAQMLSDVHQTPLKEGDLGYIDGYVMGERPYIIFINESGEINLVPVHSVKALFDS